MRCWWYVVAVVIGCLAARAAAAQGQGREKPLDRIFSDWKHRQGLLQSARYVITGTTEYKDAELPPGSPVRPWRTELLLDFVHGRYRDESSEDFPNMEGTDHPVRYRERVGTSTDDGKTGYQYTHRDINGIPEEDAPDLLIAKGSGSGSGTWFHFLTPLWPVLYAHGQVPTVHAAVGPDKLTPAYDPEDFDLRGRQTFRGRDCTVVQTEPTAGGAPLHDEFWIDVNQGSAIHRHVYFNGTNPWYRLDVEWKQTELGWWPDKWTLTWTLSGHVRRIDRLRVESFEPNPAVVDSDFTLPAEPGMRVRVSEAVPPGKGLNPFLGGYKDYRVLPDGSWKEVAAKGFITAEGKELPPERGRAWVWWVAGPAVGVAAAALAYYLLRRKRKAAAARQIA